MTVKIGAENRCRNFLFLHDAVCGITKILLRRAKSRRLFYIPHKSAIAFLKNLSSFVKFKN